jgi:hypothetical protein
MPYCCFTEKRHVLQSDAEEWEGNAKCKCSERGEHEYLVWWLSRLEVKANLQIQDKIKPSMTHETAISSIHSFAHLLDAHCLDAAVDTLTDEPHVAHACQ